MNKKLELKDFLEYRFIGQPKWNPKGNILAFIVSKANEEDNSYESYLYVYKDNNYVQLTSSGKESFFYWEDDETIIFKNVRDKKDLDKLTNGEELSVFYRISVHGGEALKAFEIPLQVGSIKTLNEDKLLLQVNFNEEYSIVYTMDQESKKELLKKKKDMEDYHVLTQVPFYSNGQGYINNDRSVLFVYDSLTNELNRISDPYVDVSQSEVDEKHHKIYYAASVFETISPLKDELYVYDLISKETKKLLNDVLSIRDFKVMDDVVFIAGSTCETYGINENPKFYHFHLKDNTLEMIFDYSKSIGSSVGSDCRLSGGKTTSMFNGKYYFISTVEDGSLIQSFNGQNEVVNEVTVVGSVDSFDIVEGKIACVAMNEGKLQEVYLYTDHLIQLTDFNTAILKDKYVATYEELRFERDGLELHGWVLKPKDYDESKSYPAILDIHGGPKTVYGPVFYHEMQVWANQGAFVLFMNPRGGDGRGNDFANIRGKYGTGDYDDLMMFCDLALTKYPNIDKQRLGVTGGSYGGFMTNWIIGHTDRFVSAASQRSIANWIGFSYSSDIGPYFAPDQNAANLYDDIDKLWWHSPLKYARNVKTPTLFIHSDEDYRCPYFEGLQMYGALIEQKVPTKLVMFKGENHELSRSGKPKHRVKRLEEITEWLFKYF